MPSTYHESDLKHEHGLVPANLEYEGVPTVSDPFFHLDVMSNDERSESKFGNEFKIGLILKAVPIAHRL